MVAGVEVDALLDSHRQGSGLDGRLYFDPAVFASELERVWKASWLYAGPSAAVRETGDYFRFELGDWSLVIVRGEDARIHALHNTCRHRGMPFCADAAGHARRWICPYHQWTYALDGHLLACGGMEGELDRHDFALHRAAVEEVGGLVFVWLGAQPSPIDAARAELEPLLAAQGLPTARVAHEITYDVAANWKLIWENNRECWHCHRGHPQYVRANFDAAPDTARVRALAAARAAEHDAALGGSGLSVNHAQPGLYPFPTPERWWSANRTPLAEGFLTESLDGRAVGPLMGAYMARDVGTLRVRTMPNAWCHASADHAVITRLAPLGPQLTRITVQWLLDEHAREGIDYELDRLLPFWQLTSEQDWSLCERNQVGVRNPAFTPGPHSTAREYNVIAFIEWYVHRMRTEAPSG